jgi:hypothetical protein
MKGTAQTNKDATVLGVCRVVAVSSNEARRKIIGHIGEQNVPQIPDNATPEERRHIEHHWHKWRVASLTMAPSDDSLPKDKDIFFADWDDFNPLEPEQPA